MKRIKPHSPARRVRASCLPALLVILLTAPIRAQDTPPEMRVLTRDDGTVFVYHTADVPLDYGIHLYRIAGGDTVAVTDTTLFAARDPVELEAMAGSDVMTLLASLLGTDRFVEIFLRLRGDPMLNRAWTFAHPGVARALGRLAIDSTATTGSRVTYRVEIVNPLGEPSGFALEQSALLVPVVPATPSDVALSNTEDRLEVSWSYPQSANMEDNVNEFRVYLSGLDQSSYDEEAGIRVPRNNAVDRFTFRLPIDASTVGRSVNARVVALNVAGQMSLPAEASDYTIADNAPPSAPAGVRAAVSAETGQVEVRWTAPSESGVAGHFVYRARSTRDPEAFVKLSEQPVDVQETVYADDVDEDDEALFYKVSAVDQAGNESDLSAAALVILRDVTPPEAPQSLTAEALPAGGIRLSWTPSSADDVRLYVLSRRRLVHGSAPGYLRLTGEDFRLTSFEDGTGDTERLQEGAGYRYAVVAVDSSYNVSDTTFVDAQAPDHTAPDAPRGLAAMNDRGFRVSLTWNPPVAQDIASFVLYRAEAGGQPTELDRVQPRTYRAMDEEVQPGQVYEYYASAVDSAGNEGARSPAAALRFSDLTPPRSVRNVRASCLDGGGVSLSWEPVPDDDLAGYEVLGSDIPTGVFTALTSALLESTEWMDPSGVNGSWYRIVAVDTSGERSTPSRSAGACVASEQ